MSASRDRPPPDTGGVPTLDEPRELREIASRLDSSASHIHHNRSRFVPGLNQANEATSDVSGFHVDPAREDRQVPEVVRNVVVVANPLVRLGCVGPVLLILIAPNGIHDQNVDQVLHRPVERELAGLATSEDVDTGSHQTVQRPVTRPLPHCGRSITRICALHRQRRSDPR